MSLPVVAAGHTSPVVAVDWSPDGRLLTADADGRCCTWQADDLGSAPHVDELGPGLTTASFAPDGGLVAAFYGRVVVLRPGGGTDAYDIPLKNGIGEIAELLWSPDRSRLAVVEEARRPSLSRSIAVLTPGRREGRALFDIHEVDVHEVVDAVAWDGPDRLLIASGSTLLEVGGRGDVHLVAEVPEPVAAVGRSPDGERVAAVGPHTIWLGSTWGELGELQHRRSFGSLRVPAVVSWAPDGRRLIVGAYPIVAMEVGDDLDRIRVTGEADTWIAAVVWAPDASRVLTLERTGTAYLRDPVDLRLLSTLDRRWADDGTQLGSVRVSRPFMGGRGPGPSPSLPIEIRDSALRLVVRSVGAGRLDLRPGNYQVLALGPTGMQEVAVAAVRAGEQQVVEQPEAVPIGREPGDTYPDVPVEGETSPGDSPLHEFVLLEVAGAEVSGEGPSWRAGPTGEPVVATATFAHDGRRHRCSLPVHGTRGPVECLIDGVADADGRDRLLVRVGSARPLVSLVESLVRSGGVLDAPGVVEDSVRLLQQKMYDAPGAVLGAVTLRRLGLLDDRGHWVRNLAERFPWLVDGRILLAALLSEQGPDGRAEGLAVLMGTVGERPLLTDSLSLQVALLRRWPDERAAGARGRRQAVHRMAPLLAAVDWSALYLTDVDGP